MNRLDPHSLLGRLKAAGVWSKKSFGQHFLVDEGALAAMVKTADILPGERVVEIGPGLGVLTERLLEAGAAVTAFEADPDMIRILREDFPDLNLVEGDALRTVPERLGEGSYKVVANIPYQITTPLIRLFLESGLQPPLSLTLLVQKEVGGRLAAPERSGERGYLSVLLQYYADVSAVRNVPSVSFWPPPKVDSVIVHAAVRGERALDPVEERAFFKYVKTAFLEPRKQLKNVLAGMRGVSSAEMASRLQGLGFVETVRAQELSVADWLNLYRSHV